MLAAVMKARALNERSKLSECGLDVQLKLHAAVCKARCKLFNSSDVELGLLRSVEHLQHMMLVGRLLGPSQGSRNARARRRNARARAQAAAGADEQDFFEPDGDDAEEEEDEAALDEAALDEVLAH